MSRFALSYAVVLGSCFAGIFLLKAAEQERAPLDAGKAPVAEAGVLRPPARPKHAKRNLESAADLAADLAQTVRFLEDGQAYYRAYGRGTHTVRENELFLGFLQAYESEQAVAVKEVAALSQWVRERGSLDSAAP